MRFALCNGGGGGGGGGRSGGGDGSGGVADGREISWDDPLLKESLIFSFFGKTIQKLKLIFTLTCSNKLPIG